MFECKYQLDVHDRSGDDLSVIDGQYLVDRHELDRRARKFCLRLVDLYGVSDTMVVSSS